MRTPTRIDTCKHPPEYNLRLLIMYPQPTVAAAWSRRSSNFTFQHGLPPGHQSHGGGAGARGGVSPGEQPTKPDPDGPSGQAWPASLQVEFAASVAGMLPGTSLDTVDPLPPPLTLNTHIDRKPHTHLNTHTSACHCSRALRGPGTQSGCRAGKSVPSGFSLRGNFPSYLPSPLHPNTPPSPASPSLKLPRSQCQECRTAQDATTSEED